MLHAHAKKTHAHHAHNGRVQWACAHTRPRFSSYAHMGVCTFLHTPIMGVGTNFPKNRPRAHMGVCIKKSPRRVLHARTRPLWACALENRDQCAFNNKCPRECFVAEYLELALKELRMEALRRSKFPHFFGFDINRNLNSGYTT